MGLQGTKVAQIDPLEYGEMAYVKKNGAVYVTKMAWADPRRAAKSAPSRYAKLEKTAAKKAAPKKVATAKKKATTTKKRTTTKKKATKKKSGGLRGFFGF